MPERAFHIAGADAPFKPAPAVGADTDAVLAEAGITLDTGAAR